MDNFTRVLSASIDLQTGVIGDADPTPIILRMLGTAHPDTGFKLKDYYTKWKDIKVKY